MIKDMEITCVNQKEFTWARGWALTSEAHLGRSHTRDRQNLEASDQMPFPSVEPSFAQQGFFCI